MLLILMVFLVSCTQKQVVTEPGKEIAEKQVARAIQGLQAANRLTKAGPAFRPKIVDGRRPVKN